MYGVPSYVAIIVLPLSPLLHGVLRLEMQPCRHHPCSEFLQLHLLPLIPHGNEQGRLLDLVVGGRGVISVRPSSQCSPQASKFIKKFKFQSTLDLDIDGYHDHRPSKLSSDRPFPPYASRPLSSGHILHSTYHVFARERPWKLNSADAQPFLSLLYFVLTLRVLYIPYTIGLTTRVILPSRTRKGVARHGICLTASCMHASALHHVVTLAQRQLADLEVSRAFRVAVLCSFALVQVLYELDFDPRPQSCGMGG